MSESSESDVKEEAKYLELADFLENNPPNQLVAVSDLGRQKQTQYGVRSLMRFPEIQLHCDHERCNGARFFRCISDEEIRLHPKGFEFFYLTYRCSNCQENEKVFSLAAKVFEVGAPAGECYKFGELPTFGPPVSPKLIKLIGPDREEFLKGRRCENQGLGVGSFIYYRRVVENQKNRILEQILKVSEKIGTPDENLDKLKAAIHETQFSKAMDLAKPAIPESLLINGHNPISLLHSALSEGVHALSDEECLDIAGSVRVVLGELSERLSQALKDEAEVARALSHLMNRNKS